MSNPRSRWLSWERTPRVLAILAGLAVLSLFIASLVFLITTELKTLSIEDLYFEPTASNESSDQARQSVPATRPFADEPTDIRSGSEVRRTPAEAQPSPLPSPVNRSPANTESSPEPDAVYDDLVVSYLIERFIERGIAEVNVCQNLTSIQGPPPNEPSEFRTALRNHAARITPENPFIDAALAPMGAVLNIAPVASVLGDIRAYKDTGDFSYLQGEDFDSQVSLATAELVINQPRLELIAQHAYHLYVIARATSILPGLANNSLTTELCTTIEGRLEAALTQALPETAEQRINQENALREEKASVLRLLADSGLSPQAVGFNPNASTRVSATVSEEGISLRTAWMQNAFGTGFVIPTSESE